jgi:hypothetical protein
LRDGTRPQRQGAAIDSPEKSAKRAGKRILFLSLRRIVARGGDWREILSAVTVLDLVLRRMQRRLHRVRNLVWANREETKIMMRGMAYDKWKIPVQNHSGHKLKQTI